MVPAAVCQCHGLRPSPDRTLGGQADNCWPDLKRKFRAEVTLNPDSFGALTVANDDRPDQIASHLDVAARDEIFCDQTSTGPAAGNDKVTAAGNPAGDSIDHVDDDLSLKPMPAGNFTCSGIGASAAHAPAERIRHASLSRRHPELFRTKYNGRATHSQPGGSFFAGKLLSGGPQSST
jgi:hypothetical protein